MNNKWHPRTNEVEHIKCFVLRLNHIKHKEDVSLQDTDI